MSSKSKTIKSLECQKSPNRNSQSIKPKYAVSSRRPVKARRTPNLYPTEEKEQMDLVVYLDNRFGYYGWVHVPNEQKGGLKRMGRILKTGVKPGFPDILIFKPIPSRDSFCMAIELKRQKAANPKTTPNQKIWIFELKERNFWTVIAYGAQDAINKINEVYGK